MTTPREELIEILECMPDTVDYDDLIEMLRYRQSMQKSLERVERGEDIGQEEIKDRVRKQIFH